MTRKEVGSRILNLVNEKTELALPAAAINDLVVSAKRELLPAVNDWVNDGSADSLKGALFLLQAAGVITMSELEKLTDLIYDAE